MKQLSLESARRASGRGGWRPNAGRKKGERRYVPHAARERFAGRFPLHVTMRVADGVPRLRRGRIIRCVRVAIAAAHRTDFGIVHFNVLGNHLHLVCEAASADVLARGMQGFAVRVARGVNKVCERRGRFFAERYHLRVLRTPQQVRNCVAYVLLNARKHACGELAADWVDPYSSGPWFDGWDRPVPTSEPWMRELLLQPCPTAAPRTWLLATGWRLGGALSVDAVSGASPPRGGS